MLAIKIEERKRIFSLVSKLRDPNFNLEISEKILKREAAKLIELQYSLLVEIASMETQYPNSTVKNMARKARIVIF